MGKDELRMFWKFVALVAIGGCSAGIWSQRAIMQSAAVEHGAAYYHPETGAFTWKEQPND